MPIANNTLLVESNYKEIFLSTLGVILGAFSLACGRCLSLFEQLEERGAYRF
jgi:hypothetical protein